ncbi:MAG: RidA family protein [Acidobacteriota bacterium]
MSQRRFIADGPGLPAWSNPISHAVVVNGLCFISGQLSVDAAGQYVPGTIREEAERAFGNLFAAARAAGFSKEEIVFVDLAFADLSELEPVNQLYCELFPAGRRPARTIYEAARLPFDGKIKVTATAAR